MNVSELMAKANQRLVDQKAEIKRLESLVAKSLALHRFTVANINHATGKDYYYTPAEEGLLEALKPAGGRMMSERDRWIYELGQRHPNLAFGVSDAYIGRRGKDKDEIAKLKEQIPQWVSVDDRLPKDGAVCFVLSHGVYKNTDIVIDRVFQNPNTTHWLTNVPPAPSEAAK